MKLSGIGCRMGAILLGAFLLAGCETSSSPDYKFDPLKEDAPGVPGAAAGQQPAVDPDGNPILHSGDALTVSFQDVVQPISPMEVTVKEDGYVTLIYNKSFLADGKTAGQLERDIRAAYVPSYFKNMTPTVIIKDRFFTVGGEVRQPGRQAYVGKMTVTRAVTIAGGFTDFARKGKVQLNRASGKKYVINVPNALANPDKDLPVFPGDLIFVPKRIF